MSKHEAVLHHLKTKGSITALEALGVHGIFRLASCIERFRKAGHDIVSEKRRDPNGQEYARYAYIGYVGYDTRSIADPGLPNRDCGVIA